MTLVKYARPAFLLNRSPFEAVNRLQEEVQRLLEAPLSDFGTQFFNVWAPALDVYEDKDNIVVKLEVPGMKRENFDLALHDGVLSISGERKFEEKRQKAAGYRAERFEGRFQRSVTLPKAVQTDKVSATYRDGILTVTLPIAAEARPKQIVVGAE
ncbi:MAG: Hsp20/alpha crystallin family protein [Verrucomicrobiales bacterium]|nr:Hsp20/alpha crystallin family protein [Verrucomicrobiales bacterium]